MPAHDLEEAPDGAIRVVGAWSRVAAQVDQAGDLMAVFQLEDLQTSVEVMVFPKTMQKFGHVLVDDAIVILKAGSTPETTSPSSWPPSRALRAGHRRRRRPDQRVAHALSEHSGRLKGLLHEHPGESQVFLAPRRQDRPPSDQFASTRPTRLWRAPRRWLGATRCLLDAAVAATASQHHRVSTSSRTPTSLFAVRSSASSVCRLVPATE